KFDDDRARSPQQRTARPEQSGIERSWHAGQTSPRIEMGNSRLVTRFGAGRAASAFGKDHELSRAGPGDRSLRPRGHAGQGGHTGAAVDRDEAGFPRVPAE